MSTIPLYRSALYSYSTKIPKSKFVAGVQCLKRLYFLVHDPKCGTQPDWAVRMLVVLTFFAYFVAPSRWMFALLLVCFVAVGVWALLYPEGVLGWAKTPIPL